VAHTDKRCLPHPPPRENYKHASGKIPAAKHFLFKYFQYIYHEPLPISKLLQSAMVSFSQYGTQSSNAIGAVIGSIGKGKEVH